MKDQRSGKYAWMVKVGDKGQIVIPKEARELFKIEPGDNLLMLGDKKRGLAIVNREDFTRITNRVIGANFDEE